MRLTAITFRQNSTRKQFLFGPKPSYPRNSLTDIIRSLVIRSVIRLPVGHHVPGPKRGLRWPVLFRSAQYERDPGFRAVLLGHFRRGLLVAGLLGIFVVTVYIAGQIGRPFHLFSYQDDAVILWDKIIIVALSLLIIVISRTTFRLSTGRLVIAGIVLVMGSVSLLDDILGAGFNIDMLFSEIQQGSAVELALKDLPLRHTPQWLTLIILLTVVAMPLRIWQALAISTMLSILYVLGTPYLAGIMGIEGLAFSQPQIAYIIVISILFPCISELLYRSRYIQYEARNRVERLNEQLAGVMQELLDKQSQLVHAERIASLGNLTAGIAHELRNPLNFVTNFSQLNVDLIEELRQALKEIGSGPEIDLPENAEEIFFCLESNTQIIHHHSQRADGIVSSMMDHARTVTGSRRPVDVNNLLDQVISASNQQMQASNPDFEAEVIRAYEPSVGSFEAVPQDLSRVFSYLLNNAFYSVLEKKNTSDQTYRPVVNVNTRRLHQAIEIRIGDNGCGIPEENRDRIFEPFFTTKPPGTGAGMGLSLGYEIVVHGYLGTLVLESDVGEGATFIITLPVEAE